MSCVTELKLHSGLVLTVVSLLTSNLMAADAPEAGSGPAGPTWQQKVAAELPLLGHRNWIVIADSAYPAQSRAGIDTIYVGGDQEEAVAEVLKLVDGAKHVRGVVYVDAELESVAEADAPGVEHYRQQLNGLFADRPIRKEMHESIIARLDEAAKLFRVLILKTDCTIPYTSVFIELDCGYWSAEKEQRLRESFGKAAPE